MGNGRHLPGPCHYQLWDVVYSGRSLFPSFSFLVNFRSSWRPGNLVLVLETISCINYRYPTLNKRTKTSSVSYHLYRYRLRGNRRSSGFRSPTPSPFYAYPLTFHIQSISPSLCSCLRGKTVCEIDKSTL